MMAKPDFLSWMEGALQAAYEQGAVDILERQLEEKNTEEAWMEARATVVAILNENKPQIKWPEEIETRVVALHEESKGMEAFLAGVAWLKSRVEEMNK